MDVQGFDEPTLRVIGERLLAEPPTGEDGPVQASADGLVSVIMGPRLEITSLTLEGVGLALEERARLERALTAAVNEAIRSLAGRQEERFRALAAPPAE